MKTTKKAKKAKQSGSWKAWFVDAADGSRPGLEFLSGLPRAQRETLYAVVAAARDAQPRTLSTSLGLWQAVEGRGDVTLNGVYAASAADAKQRFRLFCVVDRKAPGGPALLVLSGDARPLGRDELSLAVLRRVRAEARRDRATAPGGVARGDPVERALRRELEDPYFRAGFERKLAKIKATNQLLGSLEVARVKKQLTKAEVARRIDRRPEAVARVLAGKDASPTLDTIADLAYALGLEIELRIRPRRKRGKEARVPLAVEPPR